MNDQMLKETRVQGKQGEYNVGFCYNCQLLNTTTSGFMLQSVTPFTSS